MSAITSIQFPRGGDWVTVAQLSERTGKSRRTIIWACKHGDLARCHRFADNPKGGPKILQIDLSAPTCPQEYRARQEAESAEHGEIHTLTESQSKKAAKLASLLEEVENHLRTRRENNINDGRRESDVVAAFLDGKRLFDRDVPSIRSYYRHKKEYLAGGRRLSSLADGRAVVGGGVAAECDEEALSFFATAYLTQDQRQASTCYEKTLEAAAQHGWRVPSIDTLKRRLDQRVPPAEQLRRRQGEKMHRDRCEAHLLRDWTTLAGNESWVSDHCQLDVIGVDDLPGANQKEYSRPSRMWLTTWMDERSRYICGVRVHRGPNSREVLASFHDAILAEGIPDHIRIDNGKDYRCERFAGGRQWRQELVRLQVDEAAVRPLLFDLGITPHYAQPYNARAKIVEPWHRHCIKEHFSKWVPGYCGGSVEEKPEQLADVIAKWEKTGEGLMPWSRLIDLLGQVLAGYNKQGHDGLMGQCPAFVRQQTMAGVTRRVADPRAAALFLECRIKTCGTFLEIDGAHYGLGNPKIIERQGEKVKVRIDEMNAGRVYVYDLKGVFITAAENAGRLAANATREDVREAQKIVSRHNKLAREMAQTDSIIRSIDPAVAIALQNTRGAQQPSPETALDEISNYRPVSWQRADDGGFVGGGLPFRPIAPAPDGSKVVREVQAIQGTDSTEQNLDGDSQTDHALDILAG